METSDKIKNVTNQIVTGKDFFGRIEEVQNGWSLIEEGNSLILDAPRRVGKSSFAHKMKDIAIGEKWNYVFCNVQKCQSENSFFENFIAELEKNRLYKKLRKKLKPTKVTLNPGALGFKLGSIEWENHCKEGYVKLQNELDHSKNTLIVIDELTVYLKYLKGKNNERINSAIFFLDWLDGLREMPDSKIRWILCSSISINYFLEEHEINNKMKGLEEFPIDAMKGNEPVLLIDALAESKGIVFSDEAKSCLLNKLGWHLPFYIQLLFKAVKELKEINVSAATIEKAYQNLLNVEKEGTYFKTLIQDLKNYKEKKDIAKPLLTAISKPADGCSENILKSLVVNEIKDEKEAKNILNDLLEKLINDGYIMCDKGAKKYVFRSPFVRDLWYNKFVK